MVRAFASHQSVTRSDLSMDIIIMWVEFVVGSNPFCKSLIFGYSGFPLSLKANISYSFSMWNAQTHVNTQALKNSYM